MKNSIFGAQIEMDANGNTRPDRETLDKFFQSTLDLSTESPDPQTLVSTGNSPICTRGNISVVCGVPGSRKSFLCVGIAGAFLTDEGFLGMENPSGTGNLLWFDTEQSGCHVSRIGRRLHRICGLPTDKNSETIEIHMLREFSFEDRKRIIEAGIELRKPDFVIIDGLADCIADVNDPKASSEIVSWIMRLSKQYDCHILVVIHTNIGGDKVRGHLGSEAMRKAESVLNVVPKGEVSTVESKKSRDITPPTFSFRIVDGLPSLVTCNGDKQDSQERKRRELRDLFQAIMKTNETYSYTTLWETIKAYKGCGVSTAKGKISDGTDLRVITKNEVGEYHLPYETPHQTTLPIDASKHYMV